MTDEPEGAGDKATVRPHPIAMLYASGPALAVVAPLVITSLIFSATGDNSLDPNDPWWYVIFERVELAIAALASFIPAIRIMFTTYTFDAQGIRVRTQILAKSDHRVSWEKVTSMQTGRGLLDRAFGLEKITVVAYGRRGATLHLLGLQQNAEFSQRVSQAMRAHCSVAALDRAD